MNEKTLKIIRVIRVIATIVCTCEIIRRFTTGESVRHLVFIIMLLMVPFKIYGNNATRKQFEDTGRGDEYKKIVIKSIIQAIIIVTLVVVGTVIYVVYFENA